MYFIRLEERGMPIVRTALAVAEKARDSRYDFGLPLDIRLFSLMH